MEEGVGVEDTDCEPACRTESTEDSLEEPDAQLHANFLKEFHRWEKHGQKNQDDELRKLCEKISISHMVTEKQLFGRSRERKVTAARACLVQGMLKEIGMSKSEIARRLGVTHAAVTKMLAKEDG